MRRTQAQQCDLPISNADPGLDALARTIIEDANNNQIIPVVPLSTLRCRVCGVSLGEIETAVIALGRNSNGAVELVFCSVGHARPSGWPWIAKPPERRVAS